MTAEPDRVVALFPEAVWDETVPPPARQDTEAEYQYLRDLLTEALTVKLRLDRDLDWVDAPLSDVAAAVTHLMLDGGRYRRSGTSPEPDVSSR